MPARSARPEGYEMLEGFSSADSGEFQMTVDRTGWLRKPVRGIVTSVKPYATHALFETHHGNHRRAWTKIHKDYAQPITRLCVVLLMDEEWLLWGVIGGGLKGLDPLPPIKVGQRIQIDSACLKELESGLYVNTSYADRIIHGKVIVQNNESFAPRM
jgi:hypothetical protein